MSKNPFNNKSSTPPSDPIAIAASTDTEKATASTEDNAASGENTDTKPKSDTVVTAESTAPAVADLGIAASTPTAVTAPSQPAAAPTSAVVVDTTVPAATLSAPTAPARGAKVQTDMVKRPSGGSQRKVTPLNVTDNKAVKISADFSALISNEKAKGTVWAQDVISFMERYAEAMAPRRIMSSTDVVNWQEGLLDKLVSIIERAPANEFNRLWRLVIAFFGEYKSACFSPVYYSRGATEWRRDPKQYQILTNLTNLLEASARDMKTVNEVVNVNSVVGKNFSEEARGRVIGFYLK